MGPYPERAPLNARHSAALNSVLAAAAQSAARQLRERRRIAAERNPRHRAELRAEHAAAVEAQRHRWSSANDPNWRDRAGLEPSVRVWSHAMPFAQDSPDALAAMEACERRLRVTQPAAMQHYGRLCAAGLHPADAMVEARALFGSATGPHRALSARDQSPALAGNEALVRVLSRNGPTTELIADIMAERRGDAMAHTMQHAAAKKGTAPFDAADLRDALERNTTLPDEVVSRIVARHAPDPARAHHGEARAAQEADDRASDLSGTVEDPAVNQGDHAPVLSSVADGARAAQAGTPVGQVAADFPHTVGHAVAHAAQHGSRGPAPVSGSKAKPHRHGRR